MKCEESFSEIELQYIFLALVNALNASRTCSLTMEFIWLDHGNLTKPPQPIIILLTYTWTNSKHMYTFNFTQKKI